MLPTTLKKIVWASSLLLLLASDLVAQNVRLSAFFLYFTHFKQIQNVKCAYLSLFIYTFDDADLKLLHFKASSNCWRSFISCIEIFRSILFCYTFGWLIPLILTFDGTLNKLHSIKHIVVSECERGKTYVPGAHKSQSGSKRCEFK